MSTELQLREPQQCCPELESKGLATPWLGLTEGRETPTLPPGLTLAERRVRAGVCRDQAETQKPLRATGHTGTHRRKKATGSSQKLEAGNGTFQRAARSKQSETPAEKSSQGNDGTGGLSEARTLYGAPVLQAHNLCVSSCRSRCARRPHI